MSTEQELKDKGKSSHHIQITKKRSKSPYTTPHIIRFTISLLVYCLLCCRIMFIMLNYTSIINGPMYTYNNRIKQRERQFYDIKINLKLPSVCFVATTEIKIIYERVENIR